MPTITLNDSRISYTDTGSGEAVLLIHCSSASGMEWHALCERLRARYRLIVPDQLGCGQSEPWSGHTPFGLASEAAPLIAILERIGTPAHVVGHSYGGGVALRVARERPDLVRSLTLIEPSAFHLLRLGGSVEKALFQEILGVAQSVTRAVTDGNYWSGMQKFVDYWNGKGSWEGMPHDARMKLIPRLAKVVLDFKALFDEPARLCDYADLNAATLLLCGDRSPGPSRRIVELLASAMPNARTERIPGAGHMSPFTHGDRVNAAIQQHLCHTASAPQAEAA